MVSDGPSEQLADRIFSQFPDRRFPLSGQWELTCRCNLKCVMCYTDCFNRPEKIRDELTTPEVVRILEELRSEGCLELTLTGGEPLIRPDFKTIYQEAHQRGFLLTVFTNGTLITPTLADLWARARPQRVEISMHGYSPNLFEKITTVTGSFEACLQGIRFLRERSIPVLLKTSAMNLNQHEIFKIKSFAESLGVGVSWSFGEYMRDDLEHTGRPYQYELSDAELLRMEKGIPELSSVKHLPSKEKMTCGGGQQTFHIDAYGGLQLCSNNRRMTYDLRRGSFHEGFFNRLPRFACPHKSATPAVEPLIPLAVFS